MQALTELMDSLNQFHIDSSHDTLQSTQSGFVSTIKFSGTPVLPPVLTAEQCLEMQMYRQEAVLRERMRGSLRSQRIAAGTGTETAQSRISGCCTEDKFGASCLQSSQDTELYRALDQTEVNSSDCAVFHKPADTSVHLIPSTKLQNQASTIDAQSCSVSDENRLSHRVNVALETMDKYFTRHNHNDTLTVPNNDDLNSIIISGTNISVSDKSRADTACRQNNLVSELSLTFEDTRDSGVFSKNTLTSTLNFDWSELAASIVGHSKDDDIWRSQSYIDDTVTSSNDHGNTSSAAENKPETLFGSERNLIERPIVSDAAVIIGSSIIAQDLPSSLNQSNDHSSHALQSSADISAYHLSDVNDVCTDNQKLHADTHFGSALDVMPHLPLQNISIAPNDFQNEYSTKGGDTAACGLLSKLVTDEISNNLAVIDVPDNRFSAEEHLQQSVAVVVQGGVSLERFLENSYTEQQVGYEIFAVDDSRDSIDTAELLAKTLSSTSSSATGTVVSFNELNETIISRDARITSNENISAEPTDIKCVEHIAHGLMNVTGDMSLRNSLLDRVALTNDDDDDEGVTSKLESDCHSESSSVVRQAELNNDQVNLTKQEIKSVPVMKLADTKLHGCRYLVTGRGVVEFQHEEENGVNDERQKLVRLCNSLNARKTQNVFEECSRTASSQVTAAVDSGPHSQAPEILSASSHTGTPLTEKVSSKSPPEITSNPNKCTTCIAQQDKCSMTLSAVVNDMDTQNTPWINPKDESQLEIREDESLQSSADLSNSPTDFVEPPASLRGQIRRDSYTLEFSSFYATSENMTSENIGIPNISDESTKMPAAVAESTKLTKPAELLGNDDSSMAESVKMAAQGFSIAAATQTAVKEEYFPLTSSIEDLKLKPFKKKLLYSDQVNESETNEQITGSVTSSSSHRKPDNRSRINICSPSINHHQHADGSLHSSARRSGVNVPKRTTQTSHIHSATTQPIAQLDASSLIEHRKNSSPAAASLTSHVNRSGVVIPDFSLDHPQVVATSESASNNAKSSVKSSMSSSMAAVRARIESERAGKMEHLHRYLQQASKMTSADSPGSNRVTTGSEVSVRDQNVQNVQSSATKFQPQISISANQEYHVPGKEFRHVSLLSDNLVANESLSKEELLLRWHVEQFEIKKRELIEQHQRHLAELLAEQERQQLMLQEELQQLSRSRSSRSCATHPSGSVCNSCHIDGNISMKTDRAEKGRYSVDRSGTSSTSRAARPNGSIDINHHHHGQSATIEVHMPRVSFPPPLKEEEGNESIYTSKKNSPSGVVVEAGMYSPTASISTTRSDDLEDVYRSPVVLHRRRTIPMSGMKSGIDANSSTSPTSSTLHSHKRRPTGLKLNVTDSIPGYLQRRLVKLSALVKGHLTRQLLKSDKVQQIIQTIKDTAEFALTFQLESPIKRGVYSLQDQRLQERVIAQLTAAMYEFYDIFFEIPMAERMGYIAQTRAMERERLFKAPTEACNSAEKKRRMSAATLKAIERKKKAQAVEASMLGQVGSTRLRSSKSRQLLDENLSVMLGGQYGHMLGGQYGQMLCSKLQRTGRSQTSPCKVSTRKVSRDPVRQRKKEKLHGAVKLKPSSPVRPPRIVSSRLAKKTSVDQAAVVPLRKVARLSDRQNSDGDIKRTTDQVDIPVNTRPENGTTEQRQYDPHDGFLCIANQASQDIKQRPHFTSNAKSVSVAANSHDVVASKKPGSKPATEVACVVVNKPLIKDAGHRSLSLKDVRNNGLLAAPVLSAAQERESVPCINNNNNTNGLHKVVSTRIPKVR